MKCPNYFLSTDNGVSSTVMQEVLNKVMVDSVTVFQI